MKKKIEQPTPAVLISFAALGAPMPSSDGRSTSCAGLASDSVGFAGSAALLAKAGITAVPVATTPTAAIAMAATVERTIDIRSFLSSRVVICRRDLQVSSWSTSNGETKLVGDEAVGC